MLYMAGGGGRVTRLHGPFVSRRQEVEDVAKFLREQGEPQYLDEITAAPSDEDEDGEGGYGSKAADRASPVISTTRPWPW